MIEKGMKHDEIVSVIESEFQDCFEVSKGVKGESHYRGSRVNCRADLLFYDRINGFLFGVEVKAFYTFNAEWMKEAFDQMVGYNNAAFAVPNHHCRPIHPHAFFLASPLTNRSKFTEDLLPRGLGLLRIRPAEGDGVINHLSLELTSGEVIWTNHLGYHPEVHELLAPQICSQKMPHEAVGVDQEGRHQRRNASVSSQNRCEQDLS